ncbi:MAG TPA: hypothetical protein VHV54_27230 [Candidatus Binatia bacterium]|nr:hypothetical protein [Candidatus Binatia bacterium]
MSSRAATLSSLRGEVGLLTEALLSQVDPYTKCYLVMEFEDESYMGTLIFEDATFCRQIYELLQKHIGEPIKEIGDLDVSYFL